jgi:hypothetical protein
MNMDVHIRRFFLSGEMVELWENPDFPFCCTRSGMQAYAEDGEWILLFSAMTMGSGDSASECGS